MRAEVYLGLGSNLGDRAGNLRKAVDAIDGLGTGLATSSFYETAPMGYSPQPTFYNAACRLWTGLDPFELLDAVLGIEKSLGRSRTFPNAPRIVDIDLLYYGNHVLRTPNLALPHPGIQDRQFVIAPLAEIAPMFRHPVTGQTSREMLDEVNTQGFARMVAPADPRSSHLIIT